MPTHLYTYTPNHLYTTYTPMHLYPDKKPVTWSSEHVYAALQLRDTASVEEKNGFLVLRCVQSYVFMFVCF